MEAQYGVDDLSNSSGRHPIEETQAVRDPVASMSNVKLERPGQGDEGFGLEKGGAYEYDDGEDEDEDEVMASSDDEEYNLTHFGISQALPVPDGLPDFDAGPPQTAEEYLRWVRFEASQCPRVTRKDVDPDVLQRQQMKTQMQLQGRVDTAAGNGISNAASNAAADCPGPGKLRRGGSALAARVPPPVMSECPDWARPSPKWLTSFLKDFLQLRRTLSSMQRQHALELSATPLPSLHNKAAWDRLCFDQWQPLEQQQEIISRSEQSGSRAAVGSGGGDNNEEIQAPPPPPLSPPPPPPLSPPPLLHGTGSGVEAEGGQRGEDEQQHSHTAVRPGHGKQGKAAGDGGGSSSSHVPHGDETDRLCGPVVRTALALDQVSVGVLIQRHVEQLGSQTALSYIRAQWLFALAAVLERPVPPDVAAAMRDLVRRCSAWRATLDQPEDPVLPRLNILLAVAGGYFGQDEHLSAAAAAAGLVDLT